MFGNRQTQGAQGQVAQRGLGVVAAARHQAQFRHYGAIRLPDDALIEEFALYAKWAAELVMSACAATNLPDRGNGAENADFANSALLTVTAYRWFEHESGLDIWRDQDGAAQEQLDLDEWWIKQLGHRFIRSVNDASNLVALTDEYTNYIDAVLNRINPILDILDTDGEWEPAS